MSRVKSHAITSPAMAVLKNIGKLALPIALIILSLIPLTVVYKWAMRTAPIVATTSSIPYARSGGYERPAVGPCDGVKRPHHFGVVPGAPINPAGQCALDFWFPPNVCIYQKQAVVRVLGFGDAPTIGPLGTECPQSNGASKGPRDVEYTWSAGEPFDGYYMLSPPKYN